MISVHSKDCIWAKLEPIVCAARDAKPVAGLTHNFYRYPARFSPAFARAVIEALTEPGDLVMDPFAGGGTTLVEALALGRHALGVDISSLSTFICEAKTIILTEREIKAVRFWAEQLPKAINMHAPGQRCTKYADAGYYRNLLGKDYWRLRKAIEQALALVNNLEGQRAQTFARCVVLKTSQWALDARKALPNVAQFREELSRQTEIMLSGALDFRTRVNNSWGMERPNITCLNRSTAGLEDDPNVAGIGAPKLVVTSPPYPGVHMLYHRWQVDGRKEAPAPFWIANKLDGAGSSYYTMGDRKYPMLRTYFDNLEAAFRSIVKICGPDTTVVQMVAFSEPEWQLPRYLEVMKSCGLRESLPWEPGGNERLWREVPNRKWHARQKDYAPASREVVLIHRKEPLNSFL